MNKDREESWALGPWCLEVERGIALGGLVGGSKNRSRERDRQADRQTNILDAE